MKVEDYIGQRFGLLVVDWPGPDKIVGKSARKQVWLSCADDCPGGGDGERLVRVDLLRAGRVMDCGCQAWRRGVRP